MKTIQDISYELAALHADKDVIEQDAQIAIRNSGLLEERLRQEIELLKVKDAEHQLLMVSANQLAPVEARIHELEQEITTIWEHSGDPNKTIQVEQGEIKIKAETAVEIYNQTGLLRELVTRHSFDEVSGYINSFNKAQVRKFLTMFAVSPAVAEITTTHTATLTLRDDDNDESTRN